MSRIRSIKPEWLDDELLAAASDEARALSIGLILMADDYGNGRASIATIAASVWRYQLERNDGENAPEVLAKASRAFRELVAIGFVGCWTESGQRYFALRNWRKHQRVDKPGKALVPSPPDGLFDGEKTEQNEYSRDIREDSTEPAGDSQQVPRPDQDQERKGREGKGDPPPAVARPPEVKKTKTRKSGMPVGFDARLTELQIAHAKAKGYLGWWARNRFEAFCNASKAKGFKYVDWDRALYNDWDRQLNEWGNTPEKLAHLAPRGAETSQKPDPERAARLAAVEAARAAEREAHHRALAAELPEGSAPPENVRTLLRGIGG